MKFQGRINSYINTTRIKVEVEFGFLNPIGKGNASVSLVEVYEAVKIEFKHCFASEVKLVLADNKVNFPKKLCI